jgi:hypothetical protein
MFREHLGLSTEIWIGRVRGSYLVSFICCDFIFIYFCFALFVFGLCPVPTIPRVFGLSILNCLLIYIVKSNKSLIGDRGKTKHIA